jgi:hypothetical protein
MKSKQGSARKAPRRKIRRNTIAELNKLGRERNAAIDDTERQNRPVSEDHTQKIREKAYEIWVLEGCPEGRELSHWDTATGFVFQE